MTRRKRAEAFVDGARNKYLNQTSEQVYSSGKIPTTKFISAANIHQKQYIKSIKNNQLTVASGAAGVGKTLLALFTGIGLVNNDQSNIVKIVYIRAAVESKEEKDILGILPGGAHEKLSPLLYPIYDNAELFMNKSSIDSCIEKGIIEVMPLALMRGRSFNNCFIIVDECSNITKTGLKTILTRCGETSKMILIGDPDQCDIDPDKNGLKDLIWRLGKQLEYYSFNDILPRIKLNIIKFTRDDIVRSHLTKFVLELYDI